MVDQVSLPQRILDANGDPAGGALITTYESGSDTPLATYTSDGLGTAHPNPIVCDSAGHPPQVFYSGSPALRLRITDSDGVLLDDMDPAIAVGTATGAAQVSFTPITGNTAMDVQTAIANNTAGRLVLEGTNTNRSNPVKTGGTGNAYTLVAPSTITAYSAGLVFLMVADRENSGAATLNVDDVGPLNLWKYDENGDAVVLISSDIVSGGAYEVIHDGTRFVIVSPTNATATKAGIIEKATTAEAQAGTVSNKYPAVSQVKDMIDTFVPVAPIAAGRLDGTGTPAFVAQTGFNASITDNGAGDYTLAFDAAEADTGYFVQVSVESPGAGTANRVFAMPYTLTTAGFSIRTTDINGTATDYDGITVTVTRAT